MHSNSTNSDATDPDRWQRTWELFEQAHALTGPERGEYLDAHCSDADLRREVESLLDADGTADDRLEEIVGVAAARAAGAATDGEAETVDTLRRLGPYQLVEELGRGGMATVYRARRVDDEFEQEVAIKVARGSEELARRFLAERQILARLVHPNIARLLDGGTEAGTAWVAMELVEGRRIDVDCDHRGLDRDQRVGLMAQVADAVHFAHRNLVVHRDLKPGNILVTETGEPKLLDFGIAKLLGDDDLPLDQTRTQQRVFTPAYASPEQIRGEPVTTASDVYSLGVVLFELVTGSLPFDAGRSSTVSELERHILEDAPAVPRNVPADLARILQTAMRKEPERRYASAEQFAGDLRRFLDGEPVLAQDDTLAYRARRFLGRHRLGVAAATAFVLLLGAFAVTTLLQSRELRRERDRALAAEAQARTEANTADEVSEFLIDLFQVADPSVSRGADPRARDILDAGVERVERELSSEPTVRARLMSTMGRVYTNLGLYEEARPLLERSLEDRLASAPGLVAGGADDRADPDPKAKEVADSLESLGELDKFEGRFDDAAEKLERALELRRAAGDEGTLDWVAGLLRLGNLRLEQGRLDDAERLGREALEQARTHLGVDHERVGDALNGLGQALMEKGNLDEAPRVLQEAVDHNARVRGPDHPSVADALANHALALRLRGDLETAAAAQRRVLEIATEIYGERHSRVALAQNNLALSLKELGRFDEAEPLQRAAMENAVAIFGEEHPMVAMTWVNYANLRMSVGDTDEAETYQRRALALNRRLHGDDHPEVATGLANLANLLHQKGDLEGAEDTYRQALELDLRTLAPDHPYIALDWNNIGRVLADQGDLQGGAEAIGRAIGIAEDSLGAEHASTAQYRGSLGAVLTRMGRYDEAEDLLTTAIEQLRAALPEGHWRVDEARGLLGANQLGAGNGAAGEALLEDSIAQLAEKLGPDAGPTKRARSALRSLRPAN